MEDKKKNPNYFKIILIILIIIFLCLYFMNIVGYYDVNKRRTILTEEQIKQFESDVANGNYIDINDYLDSKNKDYDNGFSNISLNISNGIDTILNKCLQSILKTIGKLFK